MKYHVGKNNQQGFVSIIVAMILIALISLIALGFAFLVRQNQRAGLNRQLSTQAFYAAESGVNEAVENLATLSDITSCDNTIAGATTSTQIGQQNLAGSGVKYTCVLVSRSPGNLVYDSISDTESTVANIKAASGTIASLQVAWQDTGPSPTTIFAGTAANFQLPQAKTIGGACPAGCTSAIATFPNNIGMLRTSIVPATAAGATAAKTVFMYPKSFASASTGGTASFTGNDGVFGDGRCNTNNTPRYCIVNITNINLSEFYLRMRAIYKSVAVTITAKNSSGTVVPISGAQVVVDSTGKAQDVVRRIQVRVPLTSAYYFPEFGIESASTICKRMASYATGPSIIPADPSIYGSTPPTNDPLRDLEACGLQ